MGAVFRAVDHLTGETVALKQVVATAMQPTTPEFRLALAHEFQALAALRHPHIVAVRDYGFEADHPYFTMELLPQARSFVAAAQFLSLDQKILSGHSSITQGGFGAFVSQRTGTPLSGCQHDDDCFM